MDKIALGSMGQNLLWVWGIAFLTAITTVILRFTAKFIVHYLELRDIRYQKILPLLKEKQCPKCDSKLKELSRRNRKRKYTIKTEETGLSGRQARGMGDTQGYGTTVKQTYTENYQTIKLKCDSCKRKWKYEELL